MKVTSRYSFLIIIIMLIVGCGGSPDHGQVNTPQDTMKADTTKADTSKLDTAKIDHASHDTSKASVIKKRQAILGYSYFKNIKQNETRNINAYVSIQNAISEVIDTLKEINAQVAPERKNDTASIFTQNINLYKFLQITLIDPDSDFTIKRIHDNDRQEIDTQDGNTWAWAITPRTQKENARLILKVVAEKPNGNHEAFEARNIPIVINVDTSIFRTIYIWLFNNPEKALVLILIPLVVFFWKQLVAVFKRPKKPQ